MATKEVTPSFFKCSVRKSKYDKIPQSTLDDVLNQKCTDALLAAANGTLGVPIILHIYCDGDHFHLKYTPNINYVELACKIIATFLHLNEIHHEVTADRLHDFLVQQMNEDTEMDYKCAECALHYFGLRPTLEDYAKIGKLERIEEYYHDMGPIWLFDLTYQD